MEYQTTVFPLKAQPWNNNFKAYFQIGSKRDADIIFRWGEIAS
jgi:hypothetical protein